MSGREASSMGSSCDPDSLEVVSGSAHRQLEGWIPNVASAEDLRIALENAFDYRGDVTITCKDGNKIEGYVFDRRGGATLDESLVRLLPKSGGPKISVRYSDIAALAFTGRDMAQGKSWEAWLKHYWAKKAAGENVSLKPESLE